MCKDLENRYQRVVYSSEKFAQTLVITFRRNVFIIFGHYITWQMGKHDFLIVHSCYTFHEQNASTF